jgi:hypothetical protein
VLRKNLATTYALCLPRRRCTLTSLLMKFRCGASRSAFPVGTRNAVHGWRDICRAWREFRLRIHLLRTRASRTALPLRSFAPARECRAALLRKRLNVQDRSSPRPLYLSALLYYINDQAQTAQFAKPGTAFDSLLLIGAARTAGSTS